MKNYFTNKMQRKNLFLDYKYLLISLLFFAGQSSLFAQIPAAPTVTVRWTDATGTIKTTARCGNGLMVATAAGAPTGGVYRWYSTVDGGNPLSSASGITVNTTAGTLSLSQVRFNITYYVSIFANNAESPRTPVNFTVTPQARILSGTKTGFCGNPTVPLTAQSDPLVTDPNNYEWSYFGVDTDGNAGWIQAGKGLTITANSTATYRLQVIGTTIDCTTENFVEVATNYTPNAFILDGATEGAGTQRIDRYCAGSTNTLNARVDEGSTYTWLFSATNGSIASFTTVGTGIALSPANTEGFYRVRVNKNGCFQDSDPVQVIKSDIPTATISNSGTAAFCQGETRVLTGVTDLGDTYVWEYAAFATGTFTTASGVNNAKTYEATQAGAYRVTISKGVGSQCVKTSDPITLTIIDEPTVEKADSDITICKGEKKTLTAKAQVAGYPTPKYQWYRSNTPFNPANQGTEITGATAETYTQAEEAGFYRVKVTPAACPAGGVFSAMVRASVFEAKVSNGSVFELCDGASQVLQGLSVNNGTYAWKYSTTATGTFNPATGTNNTQNYTAFTTGFYRLEVTSTDPLANPCPMQTADIEIKQKEAKVEGKNPTAFCVSTGTGVTLRAEAGGTSYLWSYSGNKNGPFATATAPNSTANYTATVSGYYRIQLTKDGCPLANTIEVNESIEPPAVSITEAPKTSFCQNAAGGNFVELNASPGGLIYKWFKGATPSGTFTTVKDTNTGEDINTGEYRARETGYYYVEGRFVDDGCVKTSTVVFVEALTTIDKATIVGETTVFMCPDGNVTLTASPANPAYTYQWLKSSTPFISSSFTPVTGFTSANTYTTNEIDQAFKVIIFSTACAPAKLSAATSIIKDPGFTSATITGANQYCKGNSIDLTTNIKDGDEYFWKKVGTSGDVGKGLKLEVKEAGTYYVEIDRLGCRLKSGNHVVIEKDAVDKPTIIPAPIGKMCENGSITLQSSVIGTGITNKWWYLAASGFATEAAFIAAFKAKTPVIGNSITVSSLGFYLLESSQSGCGEALSDVMVLDKFPVVKPPIVEGTKITLCKNSADPNVWISTSLSGYPEYIWKRANSSGTYETLADSENNENYKVKQGGFYKVTVKDNNSDCEFTSDAIEVVEVTQLEKPVITYAPSANLCSNNQLTLNSNSVAIGYGYVWAKDNKNGTFTTVGTQSNYSPTTTGSYVFRISHPECGSATSDPIEIKDPITPTYVPTLNTKGTDFCDTYNLETPSATGRTYQWQEFISADGAYKNITGASILSNTYLVTKTGSFRVIVYDKGCEYPSTPVELRKTGVMPKPVIEQGVVINLCGDNKILLSVEEENPANKYEWLFSGDGGVTYPEPPIAVGATYQADKVGLYKVRVSSTLSPKCTNTSNPIKVNSPKAQKPVSIEQGTSISMCDKANYVLSVNSQSLDAQNYIWEFVSAGSVGFTTIFVGSTHSKITITEAGQYRVTVINSFCPVTSAVSTVTKVGTTPEAFIKESSPLEMCAGGTVKMTSLTQSSGFTYQWQYADNSTKVANNAFANVGTNSPEYTTPPTPPNGALGFYRLKITSSCPGESISPIVRVDPSSSTFFVSVPSTASFCDGQDVDITASLFGAGYYQWTLDGVIISEPIPSTNSETYPVSKAGSYGVLVTRNGCTVSSNVTVVTKGGPNKPVINHLPSTSLCGNGEVELSFTGGSSFYNYTWQRSPDGSEAGFQDRPDTKNADRYTAKETGFYRVVVNKGITSSCGETKSAAIQITDPQPITTPTIRQTSPVGLCKGGNILLDITESYDKYEWYFAEKTTPTVFALKLSSTAASGKQYYANKAGFYKVKVFKAACSVESASVEIIETTTISKPVIAGSSIINICSNGKAKMETITQSDYYGYQWKRAPLTATPTNTAAYANVAGATNPILEATQDGFYVLEIKGVNCTGTGISDYIKVNPYVASDKPAIEQPDPSEFCKDILLTVAKGTAFKWYRSTTKTGTYTLIAGETQSSYNANQIGFYQVAVTENGCENTSEPMELKSITTMPKPIFSNGATASLCTAGKLALRILNYSNSHQYQWEYAETVAQVESNTYTTVTGVTTRIYETDKGGFYRVKVSSTTCGNSTSDPVEVEVGKSLEKAEIAQGEKATFCPNSDIILNATPGKTYKYVWERSELNADKFEKIVGAVDSNYVAKKEGKYLVKITSGGCETTSGVTVVTQSSTMEKPVIKQGTKLVFCNTGVNIEAKSKSTAYTYTWQYAAKSTDVFRNVGTGEIFFVSVAGFYKVQVSAEGCGQNISEATEIIKSDEPPVAKIEQGKNATFCRNSSVALAASPQTADNIQTVTGFLFRWLYSKDGKEQYQTVGFINVHTTNIEGFYKLTVSRDGCFAESEPTEVRQTDGMPPATIDKGTKVSFCEGGSVDLKVSSKGVDYKYQWDYSETQTGTFALFSPNKEVLTVNKQGYYRLTISKAGCGQSSTVIEVLPTTNRPEATILQGTTTFFCGAGNVRLEAFRNTGYTYAWSYATERNGQYQARGTDSIFVARTPGFYRLTVSNNGCSVNSTPIEVQRLEQMPPAEFLGSGALGFCKGESTKLQSKIKSGTITYNWFFSQNGQNFEPIGTSTPELTANKGGFYRFEMSQTSCGTSRSTTIQLVEVDPVVFPKPLVTNAFTSVCLGESVELRAAANIPAAATYLWSGPDGFSAKTQNATISKTTTRSQGIYTFTANITGCEQIAKVDLRVNPLPTYTLNVIDKICAGTQNGLIEASSTTGLQYSFNGGAFGTQNKFDQLRAGTYRLLARTSDGCQTTNDIVIREVDATMTVSAGSNVTIFKNDETQLAASGGETYSWSPSTGLSATNIANPVASPRETTEYTVKVSSKNGCGVAKVTIEVKIQYTLTINNVLTPNADGSNDFWKVKNIDNHPNAEIKIFDRWGVEVFSKKGNYNNDWEGTDNSGGKLPTGAYYYLISNLSGDTDTDKAPRTGSITIFR